MLHRVVRLTVGTALVLGSLAAPAGAEMRVGEASDPAGDGPVGLDLTGASASFDSTAGTLRAEFRFASPLVADNNFNLGVSYAGLGADNACDANPLPPGGGPIGRLYAFAGSNFDVLVAGNPVNDFNDFSTYAGGRTISPDRLSVRLTGSDARLAGLDLRCVREVYLFDFATKFTPDRVVPFGLAAAPPAGVPAPSPPLPAPASPPPDGLGPTFSLPASGTSLRATRRGAVRFTIAAASEAAAGVLSLRTATRVRRTRKARPRVITLARAVFSIQAGQPATVRLTLSSANARLLRARRTLRVRARVRLTDAAGNPATRSATFALRSSR